MEKHLVLDGRIVAVAAIIIAPVVVRPLLGKYPSWHRSSAVF